MQHDDNTAEVENKMKKKTNAVDEEIDDIANRIVSEIETASSKDITNARYAKKILQLSDLNHTTKILKEIEDASAGSVCTIEKRAVIKALLLSTWMQRFYFIIRAFLMTIVGGLVTIAYITYFGKIDVYLGLLMGVIIFVVSLVSTRLLDKQITKAAKIVIKALSKHRALRDFIMNHF